MSKSQKRKFKRQLRLKGINAAVRPTAQEVAIAANLAAGMRKGEALRAAGVSPANARSNSSDIINRPGVRVALAMALDEAGVGVSRIAASLNEGLAATKVISANLLMSGSEADTPEIVDATNKPNKDGDGSAPQKAFVRVEDYAVRHKYLETSCKLLDLFPSERQAPGGEIDPGEEASMIKAAEESVKGRDISRYTVIRER